MAFSLSATWEAGGLELSSPYQFSDIDEEMWPRILRKVRFPPNFHKYDYTYLRIHRFTFTISTAK